jgi:hypothetical protein
MPNPITSTDRWYSCRLGFCDTLERSRVILQAATIAALANDCAALQMWSVSCANRDLLSVPVATAAASVSSMYDPVRMCAGAESAASPQLVEIARHDHMWAFASGMLHT